MTIGAKIKLNLTPPHDGEEGRPAQDQGAAAFPLKATTIFSAEGSDVTPASYGWSTPVWRKYLSGVMATQGDFSNHETGTADRVTLV